MNEERCIELIRGKSPVQKPINVELDPDFEELLFPGPAPPFSGIKAVIFDVYGTLFCSAAGDIAAAVSSSAKPTGHNQDRPAAETLDGLAARTCVQGTAGADLSGYFSKAVLDAHQVAHNDALLSGQTANIYPEVRVEQLWEAFPKRRQEISAEEMALEYELLVNPVYPMPGAAELIAALGRTGCLLGIISNAQFYTPLLFDAFFGGPLEKLGFSRELLIYSYREGEAKPAPSLFARALAFLENRGLAPDSAVYVGNDMRNDIRAAANAGFRTVLFAGDGRSLRLRREDPPGRGPDRVIRRLEDLPRLSGLC